MNDFLSLLEISITEFRTLLLKYKNGQGVISERNINPLVIYFEQGEWKLIAFCELRKQTRTFLFSRIYSLESTELFFPPNQFDLQNHFNSQ